MNVIDDDDDDDDDDDEHKAFLAWAGAYDAARACVANVDHGEQGRPQTFGPFYFWPNTYVSLGQALERAKGRP